jgi:predicted Rossmann-fold nucleotide-binding protein
MEILTLIQTGKIRKKVAVVLYGAEYWDRVLNMQALVDLGMIDAKDPDIFFRTDSVEDAFNYTSTWLTRNVLEETHDGAVVKATESV